MGLRRGKKPAAAKPGSREPQSNAKAKAKARAATGVRRGAPPAGRSRRQIDPDRQIRYAQLLGLAFVAAGFVAIAIGWAGMAKTAAPDAQLPTSSREARPASA